MSLSFKLSACALTVTLAMAPVMSQAWEKDKTYQITILHTNDHHGHFWHNDHGEYGLAAQKTVVDNIRDEVAKNGGSVLLLSGGDINTGVPESDLQDAEPDFKGMNLVGYDAMALGNHEFDNPLEVLRQQEKWATFPFLSANIYQKSTGERLFKPSVNRQMKRKKLLKNYELQKNPILLSLLPIWGIMTMVIMALMHRVMLKWRVLCRKAI